jgi:hypothetical protein
MRHLKRFMVWLLTGIWIDDTPEPRHYLTDQEDWKTQSPLED